MTEDIQNTQERLQTLSALLSRARLAAKMGQSFGGDRDLYEALGYPTEIKVADFAAHYKRQDIANAIINRPVNATWRGPLTLLESNDDNKTPLEKGWEDLEDRLALKSRFNRVDKLASLGNYGVLFLGLDDVSDSKDLMNPVTGKRELLYVKPLSQLSAKIAEWDEDTGSERFGFPQFYNIEVSFGQGDKTKTLKVHYSRIIHIPSTLMESDVEGLPVLEPVWNRLMDIEKISGGSAEMFWRGARPGYQGKMDDDFQMTDDLKDDLKAQINEYEHNLRRIIVMEGIKLEGLTSQVSDPSAHLDVQMQLISAQTGMPKRIFTGSERGELASTQDKGVWLELIDDRRSEHAEPTIVRPFVDRCIEYGILPPPKESYAVKWTPLEEMSDEKAAEIASKKTDALTKYASTSATQDIVPVDEYLSMFLGLTTDEIELIGEAREGAIDEEQDDFKDVDQEDEGIEEEDEE